MSCEVVRDVAHPVPEQEGSRVDDHISGSTVPRERGEGEGEQGPGGGGGKQERGSDGWFIYWAS